MYTPRIVSNSTRPDGARRMVRELPVDLRPSSRLTAVGTRALSDVELLALVLQTGDAVDLARDVLVMVGGVHDLPRYGRAELCSLPGIGASIAGRILAAVELGRRAASARSSDVAQVRNPGDAYSLLASDMTGLEQEHMRVILLDTRNNVIGVPIVYIGNLYTAVIRVAEIFKPAIRNNAAAIILAHNHPSNDPSPSPEDVKVTRQIVQAGELFDIRVLDHMIVGNGRYVSLKERGLGFEQ